MLERFNAWQRLWLMFAGVFLASALAVTAAAWPRSDPAIVADLRSPDCSQWLAPQEGGRPALDPSPAQPCYALRRLMFDRGVSLTSADDYESYLLRTGFSNAFLFLGSWAAFIGGAYLIGFGGVRLSKVIRRLRGDRRQA